MKQVVFGCVLFLSGSAYAQELFVYTEPASNVPARSLGFRLTQQFAASSSGNGVDYQLVPEIVWGASAKWMLHVEGFANSRNGSLKPEGGSLFIKYRFLSHDDIHRHFRMAFYSRWAYSSAAIIQPAIDLNGMNSGYEAGTIATKLINRMAVSGSASWIHALNNRNKAGFIFPGSYRDALGYSLSAGRLMLPKEYDNYEQLNMNWMIEFLGQTNLESGDSYIDMAPSLQFIIKSRFRIDLGYRFPLVNQLNRPASRFFLFRLEYNIFNAFK